MVHSITTEEPTFWTCACSLQLTESTTKIGGSRHRQWIQKTLQPGSAKYTTNFHQLQNHILWSFSGWPTYKSTPIITLQAKSKATYRFSSHFSSTFTYTFQLFVSSHHQTHVKTHVFVHNVALQQHLNIHQWTSGIPIQW